MHAWVYNARINELHYHIRIWGDVAEGGDLHFRKMHNPTTTGAPTYACISPSRPQE